MILNSSSGMCVRASSPKMKSAVVFFCVAVAVMCSAVISPNWEWGQRLERDRIAWELRREWEKMGLPEVPRSAPRPTKEALELMMGRSVEKAGPNKADPEFMILPAGGSSDCKWRNDSTCTRFEYNVSPNVIPSTAKLMVYESGLASPENLTIWAFCWNSSGDGISAQDVLERTDEEGNGWLFYSFAVLQNSTFWKESTRCGIEMSGVFSNDSNPPMLLVREEEQIRLQKRESPIPSVRCDAVPFNISFKEIGMDAWIIYPESFEARFWSGTCQGVSSYYEFLMDRVFRHDSTLEDSHGRCWATCCRPKEYEGLDMIHAENNNTYATRTMTNMIVKSCSCT